MGLRSTSAEAIVVILLLALAHGAAPGIARATLQNAAERQELTDAGASAELAITHGPYLQQLTDSSVMILWLTNRKSVSWVEYGKADNLRSFPTYGSVVQTARSSTRGLVDADTKLHKILLTGLQPGSDYRYRLFSKEIIDFEPYEVTFGGTVTSDVYGFTTLDPDKESFSFLALTDIHGDSERLDLTLRPVSWEGIDLVFYTGDSVDYFEGEPDIFSGFLDTSVAHFATQIPLIFVRGNHETRGGFARRLYDYFPTTTGEFYFAFSHGPVRFVVLDTGEDKEDSHPVYAGLVDFDEYRRQQARWLAEEIQSEAFRSATFRIAVFHIPPFGTRERHGVMHVREMWNDLLNEGGIDLVVNGHTHRFARLEPGEGEHDYPILILGRENIAVVSVSPAELSVTVADEDGGSTVDTFTIPASQRQRPDEGEAT